MEENDKYVMIDKLELAKIMLRVKSYDCSKKMKDYEPIEHERWMPIPKSKYYFVSDLGRVRKDFNYKDGRFTQRILKPYEFNGRLYAELRIEPGTKKKFQLHILVAQAFLTKTSTALGYFNGKQKEKDLNKMFVAVKDGNFRNCQVDNLYWKSIIRNGKPRKPKKSLTPIQIEEIVKLKNDGISQVEISKLYDISQQTISDALKKNLNK